MLTAVFLFTAFDTRSYRLLYFPLLDLFPCSETEGITGIHNKQLRNTNLALAEEKWVFLSRSLLWCKPLESWRLWRAFKGDFNNCFLSPVQQRTLSVLTWLAIASEIPLQSFQENSLPYSLRSTENSKNKQLPIIHIHTIIMKNLNILQMQPLRRKLL